MHIKKEQLCCNQELFTLKKSSYAAYKNIFGGLTYSYINIKENDKYERKKIYKI